MKKIITTLVFVFFATAMIQAQHQELTKLFNKYAEKSGWEFKSVKPGIDIETDELSDMADFINDAKLLSILSFENVDGSETDHASFKTKLNKILKKYDFESMMEISDDEDDVRILVRKDKNSKVSDFFIITSDEEEGNYIWATVN